MGLRPVLQGVPPYLWVIVPQRRDVCAVAYLVKPIKHFPQVLVGRKELSNVRLSVIYLVTGNLGHYFRHSGSIDFVACDARYSS